MTIRGNMTVTPDLISRLRQIIGTQFTPTETALVNEAIDSLTRLEAENAAKDAALKPFAAIAEGETAEQFTDGTVWMLTNGERRYGAISMGDLRKALAALHSQGQTIDG